MIHTTIGVYPNWKVLGPMGYKVNGVTSEDIAHHIEYNQTMRPGRVFFVDGILLNSGDMTPEEIKEIRCVLLPNIKNQTKDTAPYV